MCKGGNDRYYGRDLEAMAFASNYHNWIIDKCKHFTGDEIAEAGAGSGNFSGIIKNRGAKSLTLFEPSKNIYPLLKKRFAESSAVKTINSSLSEVHKNFLEEFDTVIYNNVLEHIEDDVNELKNTYHTIRSKGHLIIFVPALQCLFSEFDRTVGHKRRYSKKGLEEVVKSSGFEVIKSEYMDFAGVFFWFILFRLGGMQLTPGKTSLYDRILVPAVRFIEKYIPLPFGKNLLLIARKN